MKFEIAHLFSGITLEKYEELYFDEPFNVALCEAVNLDRELIQLDTSDGRVLREVKVAPRGRSIPGPIAKFLGGSRIEYTEKLRYELGSYRGTWESVSSLMTDKIDSRGTFRFEVAGDQVRRVVDGEIKVKVFGIGKTIEQYIVDDVKKSYENAATFTEEWIASGKV